MAAYYTPAQIIQWASLCQGYAEIDIVKKNGLNGGKLDLTLPRKIYIERLTLQDLYNEDPNHSDLYEIGNYVLSLCSPYLFKAQNATGSGSAANPSAVSGTDYLIPITGADFASALAYDSDLIVGKTLAIFWNDLSRFLYEPNTSDAEFAYTATGFVIVINGTTITDFNATTTNLANRFKLYILNP